MEILCPTILKAIMIYGEVANKLSSRISMINVMSHKKLNNSKGTTFSKL